MRYYTDLAVERAGPVLEYGCGNGRITLSIARAGVGIVGVDRAPSMMGDLRRSLEREDAAVQRRVALARGDMRTLRLARRFPLVICPFNALLHLYTRRDVEQFLARVREHLTARGELVFDVSIPEPDELARDPTRLFRTAPFRYPGRGLVRYGERFDYDPLRQILFVSMEFTPADGSEPWMTPLAHRQFYPQELEALLHYNGFRITAWYGDFDRAAPAKESMALVVHARPRRSSERE